VVRVLSESIASVSDERIYYVLMRVYTRIYAYIRVYMHSRQSHTHTPRSTYIYIHVCVVCVCVGMYVITYM
jgi:hypothetical protein